MNNQVKNLINTRIPGNLNFSQLTLSWLKGVQIGEVKYEDPDQGVNFTADTITTSKGLLALATDYTDVGIIDIKRPQATIILPTDKKTTTADTASTEVVKETIELEQAGRTEN